MGGRGRAGAGGTGNAGRWQPPPAHQVTAAVAAVAFALLATFGSPAPPATAADGATFGDPSATSRFGFGLSFEQPVDLVGTARRAEILVAGPGAIGPFVEEVDLPARRGSTVLRDALEVADGGLLPNTTVDARWRITFEDGTVSLGPAVRVTYEDDRFAWQTRAGDVVRVHWYRGDAAFGERALRIGEQAVARAAGLLGVTEREPVDFFVYAEQDAFYDALGPGTREHVAGQANAEIRTLFALITPADIGGTEVARVVPHELTHLVFDTAVDNPYHFPPRWLNEGLADYLSQGYDPGYRNLVAEAVRSRELMPLTGLTGQFPTTYGRFLLAYAESTSAVDFLIRTYREAALVSLIRSYAEGIGDDEAFTRALGVDVAGFEAAWLADLGAEPPVRQGPQPAPAGPLPSDWSGPPPAGGAGATAAPTGSAPAGGGTAPTGGGSTETGPLVLVAVVVLVGVAGAGVVAWLVLVRPGRRSPR